MLSRPLVFVAMAMFLPFAQCSKFCFETGCVNGAHYTSPELSVTTADLPNLVITVCRNGSCNSGSLIVTPAPCDGGNCAAALRCDLAGATGYPTFCFAAPTGFEDRSTVPPTYRSYRFELDILAAQREDLKDGDSYTVTVTKPGTPPLLDAHMNATYGKRYPNGRDCDGEDGYCRWATLN